MSGSPSPCSNSFVSQSGQWCPALDVSKLCVSPFGKSFVSQSGWWPGCLQLMCLLSLISQSGLWYLALGISPIHVSPVAALHSPPGLASCFMRSHVSNSFASSFSESFVSQSGWWCSALPLSVFTCLPSLVSHSG